MDAIVLAVGMGADVDVTYPGDDLDGVWESLPFIERLKTGAAARRRQARRGHRRRKHRRRRRRRGEAPRRRGLAAAVPAHGAGDAGIRARGRASPRRGSRDPPAYEPRCLRRRGPRRGRSAARRCDLAHGTRAGVGGPNRSRAANSSSPSTRSSRRSASGRGTSFEQRLLDDVERGRPHRETRRSLPPETQSTAAPASYRPWRRQSAPSRRWRRLFA